MEVFRVIAILYAAATLFAAGVATMVRDGEPLRHPSPWLLLGERASIGASVGMGALLTVLVVASTRVTVRRFEWAKRLSAELRPFPKSLSLAQVVTLAILSSVAEELFFRSVLAPWFGVTASSLLFGLVHQVKGQSRWYWAGWATLVGLGLGSIFVLTGSLWGPLLAHAAINGINLAFLRDSEPDAQRKHHGGLLRARRSSPDLGARP